VSSEKMHKSTAQTNNCWSERNSGSEYFTDSSDVWVLACGGGSRFLYVYL